MQLIAKMCPTSGKKPDTDWSHVAATAVAAHNSSIHNPLSKGSIGVTPSEIMHGSECAQYYRMDGQTHM